MRITVIDINHTPNAPFECMKIMGKEAYFLNDGKRYRYSFETIDDCDKWKSERSTENRKLGFVEDYQACDDKGFFQYAKFYKIYKSMGVAPPDPNCLAAVYGIDETLEQETDLEFVEDRISKAPDRTRPITGNVTQMHFNRKSKLKQLTDASGLPERMGEFFLEEIKWSTDEANKHLRDRAKLLGLM